MKQTDRDSLQRWEEFKEDIYKDVPVEENLSRAEIEKHRTAGSSPDRMDKVLLPRVCQIRICRLPEKGDQKMPGK